MNGHETDSHLETIAWQVMIVSVFRNTERQTLNLLLSILGIKSIDEGTRFLQQIFELVRKGVIYIPEARLEIFHDAPELVDVFLIKDFHDAMRMLVQELSELRIKINQLAKLNFIPQKVYIDLKNYSEGKYINSGD
ncbi:MAG: hypothetical protein ACXABI_17265 [Candidatus Hodarchaeales archaeon]|jgi:hypothetical protein